jgi:lipoprotein NlpD
MRSLLIICLLFSLVACAPRRPAKVDEVSAKPHRTQNRSSSRHPVRTQQQPGQYTVVKGDSLYSIGFRYQVDYKKLAAINGISPPYRIYPGQVLQIKGSVSTASQTVRTQPLKSNPKVNPQNTIKKPTDKKTVTQQQPKTTQQTVKKPANKPANKPTSQTTSKPASKPVVTSATNNTNLKWLWPTDGKIRSTFLASNPARKGISIGGKEGQPVKAAEAGVVVYSGNGLLGYGELVIIKHNDQFLSAYGHNKSLKVKEGESVSRGQVIAELGSSGTNVNNLHFEIRKNGKPVNPLDYVKP